MIHSIPRGSELQGKIKIYSDGADRESLLQMNESAVVQGMTTNPSLMRKAGVKDYRGFSQDILRVIRKKPISFEVFADEFPEMERQALEITTWGENVYTKIPIMNSKGESALPLIRKLASKGVKLNVTALLTLDQVKGVVEALKGGAPSIVSVFAGRLADTGRDPMPLMRESARLCAANGPSCELLWASTREPYNIVQAEQAGCAIITVPFDILKKLAMFGKDPLEVSLDTVKAFKADSDAAGFSM
jgi:transaldolase